MRIIVALIALLLSWGMVAIAQQHSNPWLLTWIPAYCCVTNDCCWEVKSSELDSLPDDKWRVKATDQIKERTNWSPDGKFYRCACDYEGGKWVRHERANTRCIFPPQIGF